MSFNIIIVLYVILISLIFFGLCISIIFLNSNFNKSYKHQKEKFLEEKRVLEMQFLEAQIFTMEQERERIASSFHDDINPLLAALKNHVGFVIDKQYEIKNETFKQVSTLINKIIENQNMAIRNLAPRIENIDQLTMAIREYLNCINNFKIIFDCDISEDIVIDDKILRNYYSIFLELMHNLMKHDNLNKLYVHLKLDFYSLDLILKHDGLGLTNEQYKNSIKLKEGRGLSSIRSRLNYIGAKMDLFSTQEGAIVHISSPLKNA